MVKKNNKEPVVLIYSSASRLFRTTYIGYVYEIAQKYNTILISEKLDAESKQALAKKKIFPKLKKIIPSSQYSQKDNTLYGYNRKYSAVAKAIIKNNKPTVVIIDSIINPFERYLARYAKEDGAKILSLQAGFQSLPFSEETKRNELLLRDQKSSSKHMLIISKINRNMFKLNKHITQITEYWILPLIFRTYPFLYKKLFNLNQFSWVREFDFTTFFSQREADAEEKLGRPKKQILTLQHPLKRKKTHQIMNDIYKYHTVNKENAITIMVDVNTYGHTKKDLSLIPQERYMSGRMEVVKQIVLDSEHNTDIYIKPHPVSSPEFLQYLHKNLQPISPRIKIVNPHESADIYIKKSKIIIGFPPPSTTLYISSFDKSKIVLFVDMFHELLGEVYKSYPGIVYIDKLNQLTKALKKTNRRKILEINLNENLSDREVDAADIIKAILK